MCVLNNYVFLNPLHFWFSVMEGITGTVSLAFAFRKIAHIRLIYLYIYLVVLVIEPRPGCMLDKHSTIRLCPSHFQFLLFVFRQGLTKFLKLPLNLIASCHHLSGS